MDGPLARVTVTICMPLILIVIWTSHVNSNAVPDLLPFGPAQGDSNLQNSGIYGFKDVTSPTFMAPYGFPACGTLQRNIYFTDNGLIIMHNGKKRNHAYPRPTNGNSFGASLRDRVFIAPFFSDVNEMKFSSESNVYYQVYERSGADSGQSAVLNATDETVNGLQESNFSVEWMLVITWDRVMSNSPSTLSNTFQAVIATDGRRGYTIFHYQVGHMSWDFDVLAFPDVVIGYKCPDGDSEYIQDPDPSDSIDIHKTPDKYLGNTNLTGVWVYRLDSNMDTYVNPEQKCDYWQTTQPDPASWILDDDCPCSGFQAMVDSRYELLNLTDWDFDGVGAFNWPSPKDCFYHRFKRGGSPGVLCCYDNLKTLRQFPSDVFYGAVFERFSFNPFFLTNITVLQDTYNTWIERELMPRYYCCVASSIFCGKYESKRPVRNCSSYMPQNLAWCLGDPHFTTLDNAQYTFNGHGEFYLSFIQSTTSSPLFNLQGRTTQIVTTADATATRFSYFALEHHQVNSDSIGFEVDANGTDFIVRIDQTTIATEEQLIQGFFDGMCLIKRKASQRIMFSCEDGVSVTVGVEHGVADILLAVSPFYRSRVYGGLLGNWDDDSANDFLLGLEAKKLPPMTGPNGTYSAQDFVDFGRSWKTSAGFLFYYEGSKTHGTHNNAISPTFPADLLDAADHAQLIEIKKICQNDDICIYDILANNNTAIGLATKQRHDDDFQMKGHLTNFPSLITMDMAFLEVYVGSVFKLQLFAEDRNNDNITFSLFSLVPDASITREGLFTWAPSSLDKVNLSFVADDGVLQSSMTPIVKLCNCLNETQCNYNQFQHDANLFVDKFAIASCDCPVGMSGATCEDDFNPCVLEPCFPGLVCSDQPAPSLGFICNECPSGFTGDGFTCQGTGVKIALAVILSGIGISVLVALGIWYRHRLRKKMLFEVNPEKNDGINLQKSSPSLLEDAEQ